MTGRVSTSDQFDFVALEREVGTLLVSVAHDDWCATLLHLQPCDCTRATVQSERVARAIQAAAGPHMVRGVEAKWDAFLGGIERGLAALGAKGI